MFNSLFNKVKAILPENFTLTQGYDPNGIQFFLWRNDKPDDEVSLLLPYDQVHLANQTFDELDERRFLATCASTIKHMEWRS